MCKYYFDPNQKPRVLVNITFRDTKGENVGRTESFIFDLDDWNSQTDEQLDEWQNKYITEIHYLHNSPIHSVEYIKGIYFK